MTSGGLLFMVPRSRHAELHDSLGSHCIGQEPFLSPQHTNVVWTDNGSQFASQDFADFARSYGFEHQMSSPFYPQSNGEIERKVYTVEDLLNKAEDPDAPDLP